MREWMNTVASIAMVVVMIWQGRMQPSTPAGPNVAVGQVPVVSTVVTNYWPIGVMVILVSVNSTLVWMEKWRRGKGPFLRGQLIVGSGSGPGATVQMLNGAALSDFRRDYKLMVVCGLTDPSSDKFEDERISKSAAFTITNARMEILIPYQSPMTDVLNAAIARAAQQHEAERTRPGFKHPKKTKQILVQYQLHTWTEIALLPKNIEPTMVRKLSDVRLQGGKILSEEMEHKRITQTV